MNKLADSGSSPLVRGSEARHGFATTKQRFIPARAGIGAAKLFLCLRCCGSSPLVRGSGQVRCLGQVPQRFIPARAGIGLDPAGPVGVDAVHPRSCGDRNDCFNFIFFIGGSSPLVRGSVFI